LMYCKHFALTAFPFDLTPEPDALFASSSLAEAEARLKHLLELRGIGLVTGEAGSGKTTVCRKVAAALHPGLYRVFYVPLSTGNVMAMYKSIGWELGLCAFRPTERNRASAFRVIRGEITRLTLEAKQRPVLIVDEAHHLRNEVLEDLRLLTNYRMDSENRLCLLLVGLTELRRRLAMAVHESLAQRIVVRHHLTGLTREELPAYLTHRLRLAACELALFEPPAVEALFQATQGRQRLRQSPGPLCAHQRRHRQGPHGVHRACSDRPRGGGAMTTLQELFTCRLPDHWTPEQALAVQEALDVLGDALWRGYGPQMQELLLEERCTDTETPQLNLFDPDDPCPF
ncbi:MAG: AAA family ATPase, partial [Thiohalocapsa sp.]